MPSDAAGPVADSVTPTLMSASRKRSERERQALRRTSVLRNEIDGMKAPEDGMT